MPRESCQVGGHRVHERLDIRESFLCDVDFHRSSCWSENAWSWRQNPADGTAGCNACVVQEAGIYLDATLCLWPAGSLLNRGDLFRTQARFALSFVARQRCGIEVAPKRIRDDAVGHTVLC